MDAIVEVGSEAPEIALPDLHGRVHRLSEERGRVVAIVFWSAECPWSKRGDEHIHNQEVPWVWGEGALLWRVASNETESLEVLQAVSEERSLAPVLLDPDQEAADLYGARTTPHVYVIDGEGILRYQGALNDGDWRDPQPERSYLVDGVLAALNGDSPEPVETPGRGCTIVRHSPK